MPNAATGGGNNLLLGAGRVYTSQWANNANPGEWIFMGDVEKFSCTLTANTLEKEGSTSSVRSIIASDTISLKAELAFTANEWTPDNIRKALLGTKSTWSQTSGTATDTALGNAKLGAGLKTGKRNIVVTAVKKGATTLVAATSWGGSGDYYVDTVAGIIFIFDTPTTAGLADGDALTWTGTYPTITAKTMISAMTGPITLGVMFVSDNTRGPNREVTVHKVTLTPEGAMDLISKEYGQLNFKATVQADDSQPAGQQYWVDRFM
jgi:hypothetical protein